MSLQCFWRRVKCTEFETNPTFKIFSHETQSKKGGQIPKPFPSTAVVERKANNLNSKEFIFPMPLTYETTRVSHLSDS